MKMTLMFVVVLLCAAACQMEPETRIETVIVNRVFGAATAGGRGGQGGSLLLISKEPVDETRKEALQASINLVPGRGGLGGSATVGAPGQDGADGQAGRFEVIEAPENAFDESGIEPSMVIDTGASYTIYLPDNADPMPPLVLESFRVGAGTTFDLSCDVRIRARSFVIEEGGRLTIRGRDGMDCRIGFGMELSQDPGVNGPQLFLQAESVRIDGLLDVAGNSGAEGQNGGHGGKLIIEAERFAFGPGGQILANGGDGGNGSAERQLQPAGE